MNRELVLQLAKAAGYATEIHLRNDGQTEYVWGGRMETQKLEQYTENVIKNCLFEIVYGSIGEDNKAQDFCVKIVERLKERFGIEK